jgi:hypothetical protein
LEKWYAQGLNLARKTSGTRDVRYPNEFAFGGVVYLTARQLKIDTLVGR